ncbi:hypothetical protein AUJ38_01645 [bacterium CG1_02_42_9]|nr:MAG: hypothetical protein AUJ38_01645 [bacterium CG1_02_42_9]
MPIKEIVANQLHYNLIVREVERKGILNFCQENDVMLIAFRPLQKGFLAQDKDSLVGLLCQKYQKTSAQIALKWLLSKPNVVAIPKMASLPHLKENLAVFDWEIEKADLKKLQEEYSNQQDVSEIFNLDKF